MSQFSQLKKLCFNQYLMSVKMDSKSKHFEKMESLVMKENHLLDTYGGTFVIVLTARKKKVLKKNGPRERKNPHSKSSKKGMK